MANNENLIPIPGRLHSVATEGHVSGADEIYDDTQQKDQEIINSELIAAVGTGGSVDSRISAAVATETTRAQAAEADRYTKSETYTKEEVHNLVTTPSQEYVSVTATSQTTSVTDVLPATGAADTTYRVGNWDGTQYNDSVFSEYAWNGSAYIKLSTKSQVGEVYDISANHADTKYANLAAALGTNGANIPQSLQKGGMSVKFVQSSDNKYVQYRLMDNTFSTDEADWQGVDDEPTGGSKNLVESGGVKRNIDNINIQISDSITYSGEITDISKQFILCDCDLELGKKCTLRVTSITAELTNYLTVLFTGDNGASRYDSLETDGTELHVSIAWDIKHIKIYANPNIITNTGVVVASVKTNEETLFSKVEQNKNSINTLNNKLLGDRQKTFGIIDITWEQGNIDANTGEESPSSSAMRTDYIDVTNLVDGYFNIFGSLDFRFQIICYKSDKSYDRRGDIVTNTAKISSFASSVKYIRLTAVNNDYQKLTITTPFKFISVANNNFEKITSLQTRMTAAEQSENAIKETVNNQQNQLGNCLLSDSVVVGTQFVLFDGDIVLRTVKFKVVKKTATVAIMTLLATKADGTTRYEGIDLSLLNVGDEASITFPWDSKHLKVYITPTQITSAGDIELLMSGNNSLEYRVDVLEQSTKGADTIWNLNSDRLPLINDITLSRDEYHSDTLTPLLFTHFTDIHGDEIHWKRICDYIDKLGNLVKFSIHTGDFVPANQSQFVDLYSEKVTVKPLYNILGNHDVILNNALAPIATTKALLFPQSVIDTWTDVTWGSAENAMYYYQDFPSNGLRLIFLDQYYANETERTWLANLLAETLDANNAAYGYHVVTFTHTQSNKITTNISTFNSLDRPSPEEVNGFESIIKDFVDDGGVHVVNLCGHWHWDLFGTTAQGITNLSLACATMYGGGWRNDVRTAGTRSYDCFNIVGIDVPTHTLRVIRIGSNSDNYLRNKNVLTYDYINKNILSNW